MLPTLKPGKFVLAHHTRTFKPGQIIVVFVNGREMIKRIDRHENGKVFLLGDNPEKSTDSRKFGWVGDQYIEGVVFWPRVSK
jgi:phage repressor protein C with HTH and peptisase S24 domain